MEKLKSVCSFPFVSEKEVNIAEFISSWSGLVENDLDLLDDTEMEKQVSRDSSHLDIPESSVKSLYDGLDCSKFLKNCKTLYFAPPPGVFNEEIKDDNDVNTKRDQSRDSHLNNRRYHNVFMDKPLGKATAPNFVSGKSLPSKQPLQAELTVQIFRPAIKTKARFKPQVDCEYRVLSSQPLTVLLDAFTCLCDTFSNKDCSDDPTQVFPQVAPRKVGFFLIESVAYLDTRQETVSLAQLVKWYADKDVGHLSEMVMQDVTFGQLTVRLGCPYLYVHHSNCEHLVVFTDVRLFVPGTSKWTVDKYPICSGKARSRQVTCQACSLHVCKWVCVDNKRLPFQRNYFCHSCFVSFNYDSQMNKIGQFKAFPAVFNYDINNYN